jgi:hypothetical protein
VCVGIGVGGRQSKGKVDGVRIRGDRARERERGDRERERGDRERERGQGRGAMGW